MEVEGITIAIGEVDKYIIAIQQADSAQALVKQLIDYLAKCQRKLTRGKGRSPFPHPPSQPATRSD